MARIHHVNRAQQRYAQKPVLDDDGNQVVTTLDKTTKSGRQILRRQFVRDTTKPLPMPRCDFPDCKDREIKVGQGYFHVTAKNRPTKYRHDTHPRWNSWELTSAMWAQVERVATEAADAIALAETLDDIKAAMESAAQEARDLAEQRTEAADNMEEGFGHETYASENLREHASNLEQWADDLESWEPDEDEPDESDFEESDCEVCDGTGKIDCPYADDDDHDEQCDNDGCDGVAYDCADCDGTGKVEGEESYEDALADYLEAIRDSAQDALNETPET